MAGSEYQSLGVIWIKELAGISSGSAEELVFRFRMIFRTAGILKTVSDIILVLGGYVGGSSPLSSRFELDAKYEAKASALSEASMATELLERLRGGNYEFVKLLFIYLLRDQNWFEPLGHAASLSAFF